jgi:hypothetical protein
MSEIPHLMSGGCYDNWPGRIAELSHRVDDAEAFADIDLAIARENFAWRIPSCQCVCPPLQSLHGSAS